MTEQEINAIADAVVGKLKQSDFDGHNISVDNAAKIMCKSAQYVRINMQRGLLPIGLASQLSSKEWTYYISPKLFYEYTGVRA